MVRRLGNLACLRLIILIIVILRHARERVKNPSTLRINRVEMILRWCTHLIGQRRLGKVTSVTLIKGGVTLVEGIVAKIFLFFFLRLNK